MEMSEDQIVAFKKELEAFLQDKLGSSRAYACSVSFEIMTAGNPMIRYEILGVERSFSFMRTLGCLKGISQSIAELSAALSQPLQKITPGNNPIIQPKGEPQENQKK